MNAIDGVASLLGGRRGEPVGAVRVVDPCRLSWLFLTYDPVEEAVRAGPVVPEFERLYEDQAHRTSRVGLAVTANRIDRLVHGEALALFLCAPQALYAVNRRVDFAAYRTSFGLAECEVSEEHWSRR